MSHTHRAVSIQLTGKAGEALITCHCGKEAVVGSWYTCPFKGWSKRQGPKLMDAVRAFLSSWGSY